MPSNDPVISVVVSYDTVEVATYEFDSFEDINAALIFMATKANAASGRYFRKASVVLETEYNKEPSGSTNTDLCSGPDFGALLTKK